jgi:hypothetical protein
MTEIIETDEERAARHALSAPLTAEFNRIAAERNAKRDRHPMEAPVLVTVELIDVAAHAIKLYGRETAEAVATSTGGTFREHDYRFEVTTPTGAQCCFGYQTTAADVAAWLVREGILPA